MALRDGNAHSYGRPWCRLPIEDRAAWLDPHANDLAASYFADTLPGLDAGYLRPRYDGALLVQNEGGDMVWDSLRSGGDPADLLDRLDALYRRSLEGHG